MVRSKLGVKGLVLSCLVLGLMAFAGSGVAQAAGEAGANWGYINGTGELKFFSSSLEAKPVFELENKTATLAFKTGGGTAVKILCTALEFDEGGLLGPEGLVLLGRLHFTGCVTLLNGTLSKPCEPVYKGTNKGLILTLKGEGLILLHVLGNGEKDRVVLLKPDPPSTTFADIELGPECSIGEEVPVSGELVLWDAGGNASFIEHKVTHLITEFPGLKLLKALGQPAVIEGSANVTLGGAHLGFKWAGLAG
jgi:hypothetical protein